MNKQIKLPPRANAERKYASARANLLLVVAITTLNIILTMVRSGTYFLFSATVPWIVSSVGVQLTQETGNTSALIICGAIAIVLTLPYLLCWLFSKKHVGWMIGALAYFSLDCILLLMFFDVSIIIDLVFHAWVLYYLIVGVIYGMKLRTLPEDEPMPEEGTPGQPFYTAPFSEMSSGDTPADSESSEETDPMEEVEEDEEADETEETEETEETAADTDQDSDYGF